MLVALVTIQAALGIATLVHQVPIGLALMHQAGAILALALAVVHAQRLVAEAQVDVVIPGRRAAASPESITTIGS